LKKGWALFAVLAACAKGKGAPSDAVVAEVTSPAHVTLRVREVEEPADCTSLSGLDWAKCLFRTTTTDCAWLEVDSPSLAAAPMGSKLEDCRRLGFTGARFRLAEAPYTGARLEVAPDADRFAVELAPGSGALMWLLDGEVVGAGSTAWPPDWSVAPTLSQQLPALFVQADELTRHKLSAYARRSGGDAAVVELMNLIDDQAIDHWAAMYDLLADEALKEKALAAMHDELREGDALEVLTSLIAYPELQPKDFATLMAWAAAEQVAINGSWYDYEPLLEELLKRGDARAGELACRVYGQQVLGSLYGAISEYDELSDPEAENGALSIVAKTKALCPWIQIALDRDPCASDLRCELDGGLKGDPYLDDGSQYADDLASPVAQEPLCSRAAADLAIEAPPEDEQGAPVNQHGPVLLAAAYARAAISPELLRRNARRMYRIDRPALLRPAGYDGGEEFDGWELEADEGPCRRPRALADAVCRLPLTATDLSFAGCRLHIDDKAKVVRVEELKVK
jgi:hypothetical protein